MALANFHLSVSNWFENRFGTPTEVQAESWPAIQENLYTLLAAPTGSGKTLAAFLVAIDNLVKQHVSGVLKQQTEVLYVSPLKALSNDIERNLREPLEGINRELENMGLGNSGIKVSVRTGDTTASERTSMLKVPPHILVTTPESFYLLLTSVNGRKMLSGVKSVIIDEIHAMADDKRGSHLSLSLERLEHLVALPLKRIGLSATQKPMDAISAFLTGNRPEADCKVINSIKPRKYDLGLILPDSPLTPVMSNEVWTELHQKLVNLIREHKTTLIFVNTRRLAERLTHSLDPFLDKDSITAHHGSMSKKHRENAEQRLKHGKLSALVATASLELGIDIGSVDLVVQISSPRSISAFVQRLGRSRHYVNGVPKGRLIPLTLNDLIECTALLNCVRKGELDTLHIPEKPVDVLAQQIVAEVSCSEYTLKELYEIYKKAYPFRDLTLEEFTEIAETLSKGYTTRKGRGGAYIFFDKINHTLKPKRAARLTALVNGGTIPDTFDFDVILEPENTVVGTVHEDFATESLPGDVFQLGNSSWKIKKIENGKLRVEDAHGQPPDMPFWLGEAPGRSIELSDAVSALIKEVAENVTSDPGSLVMETERVKSLFHLEQIAAEQLVKFLAFTKMAFGVLPDEETIVLERFFDQAGDTHLVLHSVFGNKVNKAWGLALRKRFCRKFNFELQAAANENGIVLSLGPTHSFPLEEVFSYLNPSNVREVLIQALLDSPVFGVRWRWNASTALAITRRSGGKRVAPQLQRMQSEDLISQIFPDQLACPENLAGDREIPDHPLIRQTLYDCLHEAMDIDLLEEILGKIQKKEIQTVAVDLREPSPMAQEVLVAQPYAFLDNAPLEERRVKAVYSRRWTSLEDASSVAQLDPQAIAKVKEEVWPRVRNADELYEALMVSGFLAVSEIAAKGEDYNSFMQELIGADRSTVISFGGLNEKLWVAVERLPELLRVFPHALIHPHIPVPEEIKKSSEAITNPLLEIIRNRLEISGPVTVSELSKFLPVKTSQIEQSLLALEAEGFAFRGHFLNKTVDEWCERRLLARIHRYTIDRLRSEIQPVSPSDFMFYLFHWQHLISEDSMDAHLQIRKVMDQLEGYETQSVAWEGDVLPSRVKSYSYTALDLLLMTGEYVWGRFKMVKGEAPQFSNVPIRTTPVSFIKRENLKYFQHKAGAGKLMAELSVYGRTVYQILLNSGALFFFQIEEISRLLKSQVEDALTELVSVGLVTSDSFTGLRTLLIPDKYYTDKRKSGKLVFTLQQAGRWWLLTEPENTQVEAVDEAFLNSIANMLLKRYGIVFRKIAEKEKLLYLWYDLLKIYRKMEARGIIRGGRFVDGFGGEQYALPEAVSYLRSIRKQEKEEVYTSISAADPLNLTGFITPGMRIPSFYGNRILYKNGTPVAYKEGKEIVFIEETDEEAQWKLRKVLIHREVQPELRPYLLL